MIKEMDMIELSTQQAEGIEKVKAWYGDQLNERDNPTPYPYDLLKPFRWFGYAGTGKTFTAARIPEALGLTNVVFGTYTGKAASVLRRSLNRYGVDYPVSTIHSAIYLPTTSAEAAQALRDARAELAELMAEQARWEAAVPGPDGSPFDEVTKDEEIFQVKERAKELEVAIPTLEANARQLRFELNPASEWAYADLIILDEVSMVNAKLAADIESFGVPILVLGDPAQLPPVEGGGYYTDAEPDHLLTEVLRAALDSPVTELATRVRLSQGEGLGLGPYDRSRASLTEAMAHDVVLCWTNNRRWAMIQAIRKSLGRRDSTPVPGDTIMCLTNNKDMAVFNGQIFTVGGPVMVTGAGYTFQAVDEEGRLRELHTYAEGFQGQEEQTRAKNTGMGMRGQRMLATFAQAITVHKAQGSEWDRVYVVNETAAMLSSVSRREGRAAALDQARSWLYTAVTRAKESVTVTVAR